MKFTFDGQAYTGYLGDTLASALLANNVHVFGRSFKYHRPRGVLGAGSEEPNALVRVGANEAQATPNLRATQVEIYVGLTAYSQNRYPSLRCDIGAFNDLLSPLLPAGFYYKTFLWPRWGWHRVYEPAVRAMAGLGRAPAAPDRDHYDQCYAHCEVLVVGAGPAGLAAALRAAESGDRVILCDEGAELGGSLLSATAYGAQGEGAQSYLVSTRAALARCQNVTLLPRTTAFGMFAQNFVALAERLTDHLADPDPALARERLWQIRARRIVLATGAIERPLVFPDNDRPGIMLAGAARTYLNRYAVRVGTRAVLVTNNDAAYVAALDLAAVGVQIAAIADTRAKPEGDYPAMARQAGLKVLAGYRVTATSGRRRIDGVTLAPAKGGVAVRERCDVLIMSGGYTPSVHLLLQARGTLRFDEALEAFVPDGVLHGICAAGACRGVFGVGNALRDGAVAGGGGEEGSSFSEEKEAKGLFSTGPLAPVEDLELDDGSKDAQVPCFFFSKKKTLSSVATRQRAFIDFQNDVTAADIALAVQEGFVSVEHVKRYTTAGMATDQGKTSNINALALVACARGTSVPAAGLTTFRMPYTPVTFGTLAGAARGTLFEPVRQTPMHDWAVVQGGVFEDVGQWRRARCFPRGQETVAKAAARECAAVRRWAGIFDASTLGKIEVTGPDSAIFLERLYVNGFRGLAPGRARYGVMLRDDGFILDDGVVGRLAPECFHVTTTTGGAAHVLARMEDYAQTEWPALRVWLTGITEAWAVISVQGPRARDMIAPFVEGIDLSAAALPHMSVREGFVCGTPCRLFRVSFTGELGFEINVRPDYAQAVWQAIWAAGESQGLTAYGTEAMHVLRAEKGYIIIGQETDGTVTPDDAGFGWAVNAKKGDFVGKRSLARAAMRDKARKELVGLLTRTPRVVLEEGAQVVAAERRGESLGHVTSSYYSAALGHSIALAMVSGGRARLGQELFVAANGDGIGVQVVRPVFYDPAGERLHG